MIRAGSSLGRHAQRLGLAVHQSEVRRASITWSDHSQKLMEPMQAMAWDRERVTGILDCCRRHNKSNPDESRQESELPRKKSRSLADRSLISSMLTTLYFLRIERRKRNSGPPSPFRHGGIAGLSRRQCSAFR